jgi:7,8-dihydropterin-6-yl-methyl-4-(beta-D-ribofuranosyl)aminobenzene 5'-phosphate synthase
MEAKLEVEFAPDEQAIRPGAGATITIVYDNNNYTRQLTSAWGFSCTVKVAQKTILFDTGGDGGVLLANMTKLGIRPSEIDVIVLSHIHGDHTGGLKEFLRHNSRVTVYLPQSFPTQIKHDISSCGAEVKSIHRPEELFEGVFTTGELNSGIEEQSLLIKVSEMFCTITGCAHPGIVNIIKQVKKIAGKEIYLAMGGFHLTWAFSSQIRYTAERLRRLGVQNIAPCHCSGDTARRIFKDYFGENYIDSGTGKEITIKHQVLHEHS